MGSEISEALKERSCKYKGSQDFLRDFDEFVLESNKSKKQNGMCKVCCSTYHSKIYLLHCVDTLKGICPHEGMLVLKTGFS